MTFLIIIFILFIIYLYYKPISKENDNTDIKNRSKKTQENNINIKNRKKVINKNTINADIEIVYKKYSGEISTRKIKINKVDNEYLYGYCFLRNANRTFKLSRIIELLDLKTNKRFKKNNILDYFYHIKNNNPSIKTTKEIDDGYFYDKVDNRIIVEINKKFHIMYRGGYGFDSIIIYLGKILEENRYFILIKKLSNNKFSGLYVDQIIEMYDLDTGEFIDNIIEFFEKYYKIEYNNFLKKQDRAIQLHKIDSFINEHLDLLKIIIYIAKSDGMINSKEKDILIDFLINLFPNISEPQKIIDKVARKHLYFESFDSFIKSASNIIDKYPNIDFLSFAEKIVSTQKSIHIEEKKILNYLSLKYNRPYKLNYISPIKQKVFNNEPCPYCNSNHTIRKGKRKYNNYISQRYSCQECGKIFSVKLNEVDESSSDN